jgi:prepilin peptidase CpaA
MLEALVLVVFPLIVAYAAATDFLTMRIANRVSVLLVLAFFPLAAAVGIPFAAFGGHVAAALVVFVVGYVLFCCGWMGGGDVKFAAAVALWLGWSELFEFTLMFSAFGGVLTLAVMALSPYLKPLPILQVGFLAGFDQRRTVPYGMALAAAALALYPKTPFMLSLV